MTCTKCGHPVEVHDGRECRYLDPRTGEAICLCYQWMADRPDVRP